MPKEHNLLDHAAIIRDFCKWLESTPHPTLKGVTDGKAIGTYIEQACRKFVSERSMLPASGSSALGQDLPQFNADVKATFLKQPQSSSPFHSIEEKIFGLPYNLLLFVHTKTDSPDGARIELHRVSYIPKELTADHRTSKLAVELAGQIKTGEVSKDEARQTLRENLSLEEGSDIQVTDKIMERLTKSPPQIGVITITFALQWRLNYNRFKTKDAIPGVTDFR